MKQKKRWPLRWLFSAAVVFLTVYFGISMVFCQVTISAKQQELALLKEQVAAQQAQNEELSRELSGSEDSIMERAARDELGYAKPNERIFVDVTGK